MSDANHEAKSGHDSEASRPSALSSAALARQTAIMSGTQIAVQMLKSNIGPDAHRSRSLLLAVRCSGGSS